MIKKIFSVIGVIIVIVLCVSFCSLLLHLVSDEEPQDTANKFEQVDYSENIVLNTTGLSSIKTIDEQKFVVVKPNVKGDYIVLDFDDISFEEFLKSNHSQLKISFDLIASNSYLIPDMDISFMYSGLIDNLDISNVKLSTVSDDTISCIAASNSSDSNLLGNFSTPGVHKLEYVFVKNADGTVTIKAVFDQYSYSKVYSGNFNEMSISHISIRLKGCLSAVSAVRVDNISVGYIPLLSAYPGESIMIPTGTVETVLGNKPMPVYSVALHDDKLSLLNVVENNQQILSVLPTVPATAYASVYLRDDYSSINVFDYNYLTIDFDVKSCSGFNFVKHMCYLLGRPNGSVKQYTSSNAWFYPDDFSVYALNTEKTHMTDVKDSIHVRYVIQVDTYTQTADLQVFFNDVLYFDSPDTFDSVNNCIQEIRIKHFEGSGSVSYANLIVKGYN